MLAFLNVYLLRDLLKVLELIFCEIFVKLLQMKLYCCTSTGVDRHIFVDDRYCSSILDSTKTQHSPHSERLFLNKNCRSEKSLLSPLILFTVLHTIGI